MLGGVARYMHEHEPWAIYLKPFGVEKSLDSWLTRWQGDGIIAAIADQKLESLSRVGIPVVDVIGVLSDAGVPLVRTHDFSVGKAGADHLVERGFTSFAFIEYAEHAWSTLRRDGFRAALEAVGFACDVYTMDYPYAGTGGPERWEQQQSELCTWIEHRRKPTGVMCSTDLMAQQFLEACLRVGVTVPDEIAVVGADNDEQICQICSPPLSSVIINDEQRGYMAASVLDKLMDGGSPPTETVWVEPNGVFSRASTDILAVDDQVVVTALRFIRDHASDNIAVDDVVRQALVSRSVLERRFRKTVGRPINGEIVRVRLNRAVQLLCETRLELKVIAIRAGFGSTSYMNAVFREKMGRTPGSYRGMDRSRGSQSAMAQHNTLA
ncbi:MAG: transcriptional regulator [Phycisphaerales bacterium]|nr:transcriptional regulator [Phycisphaerales bacterium]